MALIQRGYLRTLQAGLVGGAKLAQSGMMNMAKLYAMYKAASGAYSLGSTAFQNVVDDLVEKFSTLSPFEQQAVTGIAAGIVGSNTTNIAKAIADLHSSNGGRIIDRGIA